ncbi:hypothetical protein Efla_005918 [Eimeria flavescens]
MGLVPHVLLLLSVLACQGPAFSVRHPRGCFHLPVSRRHLRLTAAAAQRHTQQTQAFARLPGSLPRSGGSRRVGSLAQGEACGAFGPCVRPSAAALGGRAVLSSRWPRPQLLEIWPQRQRQMLSTLNMVSVRRYRVVRRNNKKRQLIEDYAPLRRRYLHNIKESKSMDERLHWHILLQQLPRDSSATRYRRRCLSTGRARGVYRHFGLCRHKIKEMIDNMEIPGWTKAEW